MTRCTVIQLRAIPPPSSPTLLPPPHTHGVKHLGIISDYHWAMYCSICVICISNTYAHTHAHAHTACICASARVCANRVSDVAAAVLLSRYQECSLTYVLYHTTVNKMY